MNTTDALNVLRNAMREDPDYAWYWYCNLVMTQYYAMSGAVHATHEVRHKIAGEGAAKFMEMCFGIDMKENPMLKAALQIESTEMDRNANE